MLKEGQRGCAPRPLPAPQAAQAAQPIRAGLAFPRHRRQRPPAAPGGSEPPNPGPARGAPSHRGCARDPADEEWRAGRPAALPCGSDAASTRHSKRRILGPELRVSEVSPGLRLRPQSRFSRFGSRAFKEPSTRPRPGHPRAPLHVTSPAPAPPRPSHPSLLAHPTTRRP